MKGGIVILDFGSQVTQLIARRFRELGVYSEILPFNVELEKIKELAPQGIILSGGPKSVSDTYSPKRDLMPLVQIAPLLGICYGMQLMAQAFKGEVEPSLKREYGLNTIQWSHPMGAHSLAQRVWMSHGDVVKRIPEGWTLAARSSTGHPAAMIGPKMWAVQFHPEVSHTEQGIEILKSFAFDLCGVKASWKAPQIVQHLLEEIKKKVTQGDVLCALSGGVDSTVMAALLTKALGSERVHCVFVDTGLLRKNEFKLVLENYKKLGFNVNGLEASSLFLAALKGVKDPEDKRKRIGNLFIEVFEKATKDLKNIEWLAQGTLYPDVIESISLRGESVTIKSHHNVGGLPEKMKLKLVEPLRELFKDEVRQIGMNLNLPHDILWRHPFPGPGLAIRIMGEVTLNDLNILKECDDIYINALKEKGLYDQIWQAFCVLLPIHTVGVQGDERTYEKVLALRAVTSHDAMTADWFEFPPDFLKEVSNRITNQVKGVNRIVYDITSKPPGTIEWE